MKSLAMPVMTPLDWFAGQALAALGGAAGAAGPGKIDLGKFCYRIADMMMEEKAARESAAGAAGADTEGGGAGEIFMEERERS
jgi:hypothetical protein